MNYLTAFIAGFLSTLVFHQGTLAILHAAALTTRAPYLATPMSPFHVPAFLSLAFWGGVWALVLWHFIGRSRTPWAYWTAWIGLGALLPSAVAWFVVLPLKGMLVAGGWSPEVIAGALLLNGAWGFGVALLLRGVGRLQSKPATAPPLTVRRQASDAPRRTPEVTDYGSDRSLRRPSDGLIGRR